MTKCCEFCGEPFKDQEVVRFIADTVFKEIPSKISYALSQNMTVNELYHRECLNYVIGGGQ